MTRELLKIRRYRAGYEIRYEEISGEEAGGGPSFVMRSAFTPDGYYIGTPVWAHRLIVGMGIKPEITPPQDPEANDGKGLICTIGFCEREQRWYGWSHRAMFGFGIGYVVKEGDCTASSGWTDEYLAEHPEADLSLPIGFETKTLGDAKRAAIAFADSIG